MGIMDKPKSMESAPPPEVVPEDPNIVKGGPIGGPMDGQPPAAGAPAGDPGSGALYTGITGELKTVDELKQHAQNLEALLIARKTEAAPVTRSFMPANPAVTAAPAASGKTFEDLIYTDPVEAKKVLKQEIRGELDKEREAERKQKGFWDSFYVKNGDLKGKERTVQSIFSRDLHLIRDMKSDRDVEEHIVREARTIIDEVKKTIGVTETRLQSAPAVAIGSSGSEFVPTTTREQKPETFIDQLARQRASRGKLKSRGNS